MKNRTPNHLAVNFAWRLTAVVSVLLSGVLAALSATAATVRYEYTPQNADGYFPEAGLTVVVPAGGSEFRWIGQGPWSGYPGMDRHNEFGLHHLNRGDLRFEGNRRGVELALLTTPAGHGLALTSPAPSSASPNPTPKPSWTRFFGKWV